MKACQGCVIDAKNQMMKNMPELCDFNQRNQNMSTPSCAVAICNSNMQ